MMETEITMPNVTKKHLKRLDHAILRRIAMDETDPWHELAKEIVAKREAYNSKVYQYKQLAQWELPA